MAVTMLIQYRADKARLFNIYQEDAERYLAGFLGDDCGRFVLCNWDAADGSSLHRQLIAAFQDIRRSTRSFPDLFIGSRTAPTAPKSTLLARHASSPLARPMAPSHQYHTNHFVSRFHGEADSSTDERSAAPKETPSSTGLRPGTAAFSAPASGVGFAAAATANGTTSARPQGFVVPKVEEESHDAILHSSPPALKRPSQESPRRGLFPPPSASYAFAKSSRSSPSPSRASHGSSASSMFSARSSATSMSSISTTASDVGTLMREVWDVRREMAALRAREAALVPLRARERPWTSEGRSEGKDEVEALRAELRAETDARRVAEASLYAERRQREFAERVVADARRECATPFVVPALMDALIQIAELSDSALFGASVVGNVVAKTMQ
ncbi:uncharacterized protein B0H18DRAFT_1031097 [Fomitopsis serialis]|uniref:uncharacterized protein n=1 Tax=Fomitopsis serialis TaxID=139415 RepID=UPI0020074739|nr:uncharacterized protein B0H18DRAFT_1031097 [Neoantrodia serialis]KAH9918508.1 hypothetical protein B0H18DRAFT_1031097 [Neoantrodia serialis]